MARDPDEDSGEAQAPKRSAGSRFQDDDFFDGEPSPEAAPEPVSFLPVSPSPPTEAARPPTPAPDAIEAGDFFANAPPPTPFPDTPAAPSDPGRFANAADERNDRVSGDAFFQARASLRDDASGVAANPVRLALVLTGAGFFAVFLQQANLVHQIVIGAPVFEELLKFGIALLAVALYRVELPAARLGIAYVPGAAFGILEHHLTYAAESMELYVGRVLFHAGATALSMAAYTALERLADVRIRWASTVPATLVHWANNFVALVGSITLVVAGADPQVLLWWGAFLTTVAHVGAWSLVANPTPFSSRAEALWSRRVKPPVRVPVQAPEAAPPEPTPEAPPPEALPEDRGAP